MAPTIQTLDFSTPAAYVRSLGALVILLNSGRPNISWTFEVKQSPNNGDTTRGHRVTVGIPCPPSEDACGQQAIDLTIEEISQSGRIWLSKATFSIRFSRIVAAHDEDTLFLDFESDDRYQAGKPASLAMGSEMATVAQLRCHGMRPDFSLPKAE